MSKEALAVVRNKETALMAPLEFSSEQVRLLADTVAKGCDQNELAFFINVCQVKRLDPFTGQVHAVKRWDSSLKRDKLVIQIGIDGYRVVAVRSGELAGISEPEYDSEEVDHPNWARVTVWRYGRDNEKIAYSAKARWSEYVQTYKDKDSGQLKVNSMWSQRGYLMLGKCAEALALRKAFPDELSGMYSEEEMGQADNPDGGHTQTQKQPVSMPKSIDEKKHAQTATTQVTSTTTANPPKTQQTAQSAPAQDQAPQAKVEEVSGVIEKCELGKGNAAGALFVIVDKKVISVPKDKVDAEMVQGAKVQLRIVPNVGGKTFTTIEVLKVQSTVVHPAAPENEPIDAEYVESEPEPQDNVQDMSGLFSDPGPSPQSKMEPEPPKAATKKGTIGVGRAQRLYALRNQNEKTTGLTEAKLKELLTKLPIPIDHLRELETGMYATLEQIVTGEEDWRPYME